MGAVDRFILGAAIPAVLFLIVAVALALLAWRAAGRRGRIGTGVAALGATGLALSFGFVAVMGALI